LCPLCGSSWTWEHFCSCEDVAPVLSSRGLTLSKFRSLIYESEWAAVYQEIAHVLLIWSLVLTRDPDLSLSYEVDVFREMILS
jgi:hypothetical protein